MNPARLVPALANLVAAMLLAACGSQQPMNVFLITMDTTRADRLGCYGNDAIETPHIDALAAAGTLYENAFTVVPVTLPSHTSMLTGTYPVFHGVRENAGFYVPEELETLAEILGDQGYDTAAFVGSFPLDSQTGIDQGFDLYDDNYPSRLDRHPRLRRFFDERPASDVARPAMAWLDQGRNAPFFLWTHFFDPHHPLQPPSPYRERYAHSPYDGEIASVDEAIGQIIGRLEENGLLDNTLVILTADHGEGLGEHGELTHALLLYSSTLRVPLIVKDPAEGRTSAGGTRRIKAPVANLDIFSTVLTRLGLEVPAVNQGVPLPYSDDDADPERQILSETMFGRLVYGWTPIYRLTAGPWVQIQSHGSELYDRSIDPDELDDLSQKELDRRALLARELDLARSTSSEGGQKFSSATVSQEVLERLASLGYIGAGASAGDDLTDDVDPERSDPMGMMPVFDLHNEALTLATAGRHELAIPLLQRAESRDPGNPAVVQALASSLIAMGKKEQGYAALNRLLEISPGHVGAHHLLADFYLGRGELQQALALVEAAVELDPSDLVAQLRLAHILEDNGLPEEAIGVYQALLAQDGQHVLAMNGLATLLSAAGDDQSAVRLLNQALDSQPFFAPAVLNLGVIEFGRGNHDRALALAQRALALRPGYPQALALRQRTLQARQAATGQSGP